MRAYSFNLQYKKWTITKLPEFAEDEWYHHMQPFFQRCNNLHQNHTTVSITVTAGLFQVGNSSFEFKAPL